VQSSNRVIRQAYFFLLLILQSGFIKGVSVSDDLISGFQFRYDIDTIFGKCRDIDIGIYKIISM